MNPAHRYADLENEVEIVRERDFSEAPNGYLRCRAVAAGTRSRGIPADATDVPGARRWGYAVLGEDAEPQRGGLYVRRIFFTTGGDEQLGTLSPRTVASAVRADSVRAGEPAQQ